MSAFKRVMVPALAAATWMAAVLPAQAEAPAKLVEGAKKNGAAFASAQIFADAKPIGLEKSLTFRSATSVLQEGTVMNLDPAAIQALRADAPEHLTLPVPFSPAKSGSLVLDLVKVDPFSADFKVVTSSPEPGAEYDLGTHYRGVVAGDAGSVVALSIFADEIMAFADTTAHGTVIIGAMEGIKSSVKRHVAYADQDLQGVDRSMECGMNDNQGTWHDESPVSVQKVTNRVPLERPASLGVEKAVGDCVRIYLEADYNIYQNKGSTQAVTNWVTGVYNQVATLYSTDNIETGLSQIYVWNSSSPYTSSSNTGTLLSQFQNTRTNYNGDLAHLMKLGNVSGVAAGFNGICSTKSQGQSVAYVQSSYSTVPTFSYTVFVVAHELGHTFGSRHTHACVWNGNNTAIDSCSGFTEGNCSLPGNPSGGGTIMSYCPGVGSGVDFNQAFHPQPASVIRGKIASASCLQTSCSGGGGGGGGGGGSTCSGSTYSGSLSGSGDSEYEPNGNYYYAGSSGTHRGVLSGPSSADFDLELLKWNGSWQKVAQGVTSNSSEDVSYNGSAGYYVWKVVSYSGSGSFSLCLDTP